MNQFTIKIETKMFKNKVNRFFKKIKLSFAEVKYDTKRFKEFRFMLTDFFSNYAVESSWLSYKITKCRMYEFPKKIVIEIHSLTPGSIIGKGGRTIDKLKQHLQSWADKEVEFVLEETNPFK